MRRTVLEVQNGFWYSLLFAVLSLASVAFIAYELLWVHTDRSLVFLFVEIDLAISYIFLTDFFVGLAASEKRWGYVRQNWLNFVSSIPVSGSAYRLLRGLRFARAFRVARAAAGMNSIMPQRKRKKRS